MQIFINNVERESEKAMLVNCPVSWNANYYKRSFWMPKSVISFINDNKTIIEVADWFINKLAGQNAFHGYPMRFDEIR